MQNFGLLKAVGKAGKPVLLKRGLAATIDEWLNAAEYIMNEGNPDVVLCERGIRTYETYTRNTLDLSAVAAVKHLSHLPIIVDPSHGTGKWRMVQPMAYAARDASEPGEGALRWPAVADAGAFRARDERRAQALCILARRADRTDGALRGIGDEKRMRFVSI